MFAPLIFLGLRACEAVRSGGVHSIFLIKNMNFFILNTLCTSRIHFVVREAWQNYFFNSKALLIGELLELHFYIRKLFY